MGTISKTALATVAGMTLALAATSATALTCSNAQSTFTLNTATAALCVSNDNDDGAGGFFDSNPTVFGLNGWMLADKNDGPAGDDAIVFLAPPVNGDTTGTWSIASYNGYTAVAIVLKAGNGFGLFRLDTALLRGDWTISRDLSHASIWYTNVAQVPLPASALLLLAGLGALAGLRRRRGG